MGRPKASEFEASLKVGQLVWASNHGNREKIHIERIVRFDGGAKSRVLGDALCGSVKAWRRRYVSRAIDDAERYGDDGLCHRCLTRFRSMGEPSVRGYNEKTEDFTDPLPTAWREVPPVGIRRDQDTYETHWRSDPKEPMRKEIRRWVRGQRYVRLCELVPEEGSSQSTVWKYAVHYGWTGEDRDHWSTKSNDMNQCLRRAWNVMRFGGAPQD